jgi:hypothetical protein
MTNTLRWQVYAPRVQSNPTNRWLTEIRLGGFIVDWKRFKTEGEARGWGSLHNGTVSQVAANEFANVIRRWLYK